MNNPVLLLWRRMLQSASRSLLRRQRLTPAALQGRQGEETAYWHLRAQGFTIVSRNYRPGSGHGEIDLVGWDDGVLVFVEVKTRTDSSPRLPEAAVDRKKEETLLATAREFRRRANCLAAPYRFDIVSVTASPNGFHVQHFRDAVRKVALPSAD